MLKAVYTHCTDEHQNVGEPTPIFQEASKDIISKIHIKAFGESSVAESLTSTGKKSSGLMFCRIISEN